MPKAIHAPEAWDALATGTGVRVAVLDGGLNYNHIDLDGSVDVDRSASFVPKTQLAALILEKNPSASPDQVYTELSTSADDLGKPGFDAVYGNGRVNAFKAVQ